MLAALDSVSCDALEHTFWRASSQLVATPTPAEPHMLHSRTPAQLGGATLHHPPATPEPRRLTRQYAHSMRIQQCSGNWTHHPVPAQPNSSPASAQPYLPPRLAQACSSCHSISVQAISSQSSACNPSARRHTVANPGPAFMSPFVRTQPSRSHATESGCLGPSHWRWANFDPPVASC